MSWTEAFTNVQDALAAAADPAEIWVAEGLYYPDVGIGQIPDSVTSTFVLTDGVNLYGGFNHGDLELTERDWVNNHTVLSGDIDENDDTDINDIVTDTDDINGNNAFHILSARIVTGTAVVDGFYITAGKTFGQNIGGGGFYCDGSGSGNHCSPVFRNVTFSGNLASDGGAMYHHGADGGNSSPTIQNATFNGNRANDGGAIFNDGMKGGVSSPILTHVTFTNNSGSYGGALFNSGYNGGVSNPKITKAAFIGNFTDDEGGVFYNEGDLGTCIPVLTNVLFFGNVGTFGAALFNTGNFGISSPIITNGTFSGNAASSEAGAIYNKGGNGTASADVRNSIFWDNMDKNFTGTITATFHNAN